MIRNARIESLEPRRLLAGGHADVSTDLLDSAPAIIADSESPQSGDVGQQLSQLGVQFYGAHWCPNCEAQRSSFGEMASSLPYVEVSNSDGSPNQTALRESIVSFPTWRFPTEVVGSRGAQLAGSLGLDVEQVILRPDHVEVRSALSLPQLSWITRVEMPVDPQTTSGANQLVAESVDSVFAKDDSEFELWGESRGVASDTSPVIRGSSGTGYPSDSPLPQDLISDGDTRPLTRDGSLAAPAQLDLAEFALDLSMAGARFFGTRGNFYSDLQASVFENTPSTQTDSLAIVSVTSSDGRLSDAAIEAGIILPNTWHFHRPVDLDAIETASQRIGKVLNRDQWTVTETDATYYGILQPQQLAAATGISIPVKQVSSTSIPITAESEAEAELFTSALTDLARQLSDSGATFYGAQWCSICRAQKEGFGDAAQWLPYVEATHPDGSPNDIAREAGIDSYPTWRFLGTFDTQAMADASDAIGREFDFGRVSFHDDGFDIAGMLFPGQLAAAIGTSWDLNAEGAGAEGEEVVGAWRNQLETFDANDDGNTSALDALVVINSISRNGGPYSIADDGSSGDYLDVSGDRTVSSLDALRIINEVGRARNRAPFAVSVSNETIHRFEGESITWEDGFGDVGVSYRVDISTRADCRGDFVESMMVQGQREFALTPGLDLGTHYACVRMQTDDGITRTARAPSGATEPTDVGAAFDVAAVHQVFATESGTTITTGQGQVSGRFGNIQGADFNCNNQAFAAGILPDWDFTSTIYQAVISDDTETAFSRLDIEGQLFNMMGERLAVDKEDFFDNELETPIFYTARGLETALDRFWHGSSNDGLNVTNFCNGWIPEGGSASVGATKRVAWMGGITGGGDCGNSGEALVCVSPPQAPVF